MQDEDGKDALSIILELGRAGAQNKIEVPRGD